MSTRHLARQKSAAARDAEGTNESDESDGPIAKKKPGFAALMNLGGSDSSDQEDPAPLQQPQPQAQPSPVDSKASKKSKKKGNKKAEKPKQDRDEDLDELIAQHASIDGTTRCGGSEIAALAVEREDLSPETEMRKLFGGRTIRAVQSELDGEADGDADLAALPRRLQRQILREQARKPAPRAKSQQQRRLFVQPAASWPSALGNGLRMDAVGDCEYVWQHRDPDVERRTAAQLTQCVSTGNPHELLNFLHFHPFHVEGLLLMERIFMQTGQFSEAFDLVARAVHAFEVSFHPRFVQQALVGGARVSSSESKENKLFVSAIALLALHSQRRGSHRAALALSKLLLGFDPTDPTLVLLRVDSRCVRAHDARTFDALEAATANLGRAQNPLLWELVTPPALVLGMDGTSLLERAQQAGCLDPTSSSRVTNRVPVRMLPSWAYSKVLVSFRQYQELLSCQSTTADALLELAQASLRDALLWFPNVLPALLKRGSASNPLSAPLIATWARAVSKGLATDAGLPMLPPTLDRLVNAYAEDAMELWRDPPLVKWLGDYVPMISRLLETGDKVSCELLRKRQRWLRDVVYTAQEDEHAGNRHLALESELRHMAIPAEALAGAELRMPRLNAARQGHGFGRGEDDLGRAHFEQLLPEDEEGEDEEYLSQLLTAQYCSLLEPWERLVGSFYADADADVTSDRESARILDAATRAMLELDAMEIPDHVARDGPLRAARRDILRRLNSVADACETRRGLAAGDAGPRSES
jgi:hypothetical protein